MDLKDRIPEGELAGNKKSLRLRKQRLFELNPGGDLLSHTATRAVPLALRGLTSVFGMGTGVTLSA